MTTLLCSTALTLSLLLPTTALHPAASSVRAHGLTPGEAFALQASLERSPATRATLEALRAGRAGAPESLRANDRAALAAAERQSTQLAALRGGSEPSDNEWKWLAIGAGIVLLIVLI